MPQELVAEKRRGLKRFALGVICIWIVFFLSGQSCNELCFMAVVSRIVSYGFYLASFALIGTVLWTRLERYAATSASVSLLSEGLVIIYAFINNKMGGCNLQCPFTTIEAIASVAILVFQGALAVRTIRLGNVAAIEVLPSN